jgi:hypothetical protein
MRSVLTAISILAIHLGGLTACTDAGGDEDVADLADGSDDEKSDRPDLAVTELEVGPPLDRDESKVVVIKSKAAWKNAFGSTAPSSINFGSEWVAYYTAGTKTSGGYSAHITKIRVSDTGKTLKISTRLDSPGSDCLVTLALTSPYTVVKFPKPSSNPTTNRYFKETNVYSCGSACSGTTVTESTYVSPADTNTSCEMLVDHCITDDNTACPQISPLPPSFCMNGTIKSVTDYVASADGMECAVTSPHCVTNDNSACPLVTPLPPNWCPNGEVKTTPRFIASSDGMECYMPVVHCVIDCAQ